MPKHPFALQSEIKASSATGDFPAFLEEVTGLYAEYCSGQNIATRNTFYNHLMREYNRKVDQLGADTSLFLEEKDNGFRMLSPSGDLATLEAGF